MIFGTENIKAFAFEFCDYYGYDRRETLNDIESVFNKILSGLKAQQYETGHFPDSLDMQFKLYDEYYRGIWDFNRGEIAVKESTEDDYNKHIKAIEDPVQAEYTAPKFSDN